MWGLEMELALTGNMGWADGHWRLFSVSVSEVPLFCIWYMVLGGTDSTHWDGMMVLFLQGHVFMTATTTARRLSVCMVIAMVMILCEP